MFDPFISAISNSPLLAQIDFRNAKFQGSVNQKNLPQGVGLILDHNYLLALSQWHLAEASGPSFIIFPDLTAFQGILSDSVPIGLCTYHTHSSTLIFALFGNEAVIFVAFDETVTKTLFFFKIEGKQLEKLANGKTSVKQQLGKFESDKKVQGVDMLEIKTYDSQKERVGLLQRFFQRQVPLQHLSYRAFIKKCFTSQSHKKEDLSSQLLISETAEEFMLSYRLSSIYCRIGQGICLDKTVKAIGYFNHSTNEHEIFKKCNSNGIVEEAIGQASFEYLQTPLQRPQQCLNMLHHYYRKSLNFHNMYLQVDYFYRIKLLFHSLEELYQGLRNTHAQKLLQKGRSDSLNINGNQKPRQKERRVNLSVPNEMNESFSPEKIDQAKHELELYLSHRRSVEPLRSTSSFNYRPLERSSSSNRFHSPNFIYDRLLKASQARPYPQDKPFFVMNTPRKSPPHLNQSTSPWISDKKYSQAPEAKTKKFSPLSKYAYLQRQSKLINQRRVQNIRNLTERLEYVEKQSRGNLPPPKEVSSILNYLHGSPLARVEQRELKKESPAIFGPRRILKRGWE